VSEPEFIDAGLLDRVSEGARSSPRLRKNHNFHPRESDICNRLLNAMEPGSYVVPHRHLDPDKDETFVVLRGRFGLVLFDEAGQVAHKAVLDCAGPAFGVTIPHGTFHSLVSLAPGALFFEAKAGPYAPLTADERAAWAPAEGDPAASGFLRRLEALFD
jgi:cupin fold WbuC family metalloprotein